MTNRVKNIDTESTTDTAARLVAKTATTGAAHRSTVDSAIFDWEARRATPATGEYVPVRYVLAGIARQMLADGATPQAVAHVVYNALEYAHQEGRGA